MQHPKDGLAVLCEKPLAPTPAEVEDIYKTAVEIGLSNFTRQNSIFRPFIRAVSFWRLFSSEMSRLV